MIDKETAIEFGRFVCAKEDYTPSVEYITELWKQFQELQEEKVMDVLNKNSNEAPSIQMQKDIQWCEKLLTPKHITRTGGLSPDTGPRH
jgi:hypothetical protein